MRSPTGRWILLAGIALALVAVACVRRDQGPTEILWDRWGVPHIHAPDAGELFRAFGWAQMKNHANLILRLYGEARGRAAEYWGESYLASDRYLRTMGVPPAVAAVVPGAAAAVQGVSEPVCGGDERLCPKAPGEYRP